eukprot:scaffold434_cov186-Pinguiococcus_pyrenoidosus.AAC.104
MSSTTENLPCVSVPVLSKATIPAPASPSSAELLRKTRPLLLQTANATASSRGLAMTTAQGQLISTALSAVRKASGTGSCIFSAR